MAEISEKQSIGSLLTDFTNEMKTLFRDEFEMMRLEMSVKISKAGKHVGFIAAGGLLILAGFMILLGAVIWLLALFMQIWIASLIVGVAVTAIGAYLIKKHMTALKMADFTPGRTMESLKQLKEEGKWLKKQM
jgi:hypothetical protein